MSSAQNENLDCLAFEDRLQDLLDQRESIVDDTWLTHHRKTCDNCSQLFADYQQLFVVSRFADLDEPISHCASDTRSMSSQVRFQGRCTVNKLTWSLAPTFAALLIVCISMYVSPSPSGRTGISMDQFDSLSSRFHVVTTLRDSTAERLSNFDRPVNSRVCSDPAVENQIDPIVESLFLRKSVLHDVQDYSNLLYEFANSRARFPTYQLMQFDLVDNVAMPLVPIHDVVLNRGQVSLIPQIRFFYGIVFELFNRSLNRFPKSSEPDLGVRPEQFVLRHWTWT